MILSGWGRYPRLPCRVLSADGETEIVAQAAAEPSLIARGHGRSYGDASFNPSATLLMGRNNRFLAFDATTGLLRCEAGTLLSEIIQAMVPRGWFPPVTPGTKFVSVGGMIAADVHGKNHHGAGSFGDHVSDLDLLLADGRIVTCSPTQNAELFLATRGGMGLTGIILRAGFRLLPIETSFIREETVRAASLDSAMNVLEESHGWTYSVAWIDCLARGAALGRSIIYRGEHARIDELPADERSTPLQARKKKKKSVPVDFPGFALNRYSVRAFNEVYYRMAREGTALIDYDTFFYPLDSILEWNRIYGASGFVQYQCVLPKAASRSGLTDLLNRIGAAGSGSFLAVLKLFGRQEGLLSFPMEGYTLALDFRADAENLALLRDLDAIVAACGGRLYLAKDARAHRTIIHKGYPRLQNFQSLRTAYDPLEKFSSAQSVRLAL